MNRKLIIIFGKPGVGKSYIANILHDAFGFIIHDGDTDLPADMKQTLEKKLPVTDTMRKKFLENMVTSVKKLTARHEKFVFHQTLLKEFMRKRLLREFPDAEFILIESDNPIRETRYMKRAYFNLGIDYLRQMTKLFEAPHIPHSIIYNNVDGEGDVRRQIIDAIPSS